MARCIDCFHCDACLRIVRSSYPSLTEVQIKSVLSRNNSCKNFKATADVVEVKHGRWIDHLVRDWRCSECGEKIHKVRQVDGYCYDDMPNYCPNCGAKMGGERRDK